MIRNSPLLTFLRTDEGEDAGEEEMDESDDEGMMPNAFRVVKPTATMFLPLLPSRG